MQNGFVESFNGRMRDELLNETLFFGLAHAKQEIAASALMPSNTDALSQTSITG